MEYQSGGLSITLLLIRECQNASDLFGESGCITHFVFVDTLGLDGDTVAFFDEVRRAVVLDPVVDGAVGVVDEFYLLLDLFHETGGEQDGVSLGLVVGQSVEELGDEQHLFPQVGVHQVVGLQVGLQSDLLQDHQHLLCVLFVVLLVDAWLSHALHQFGHRCSHIVKHTLRVDHAILQVFVQVQNLPLPILRTGLFDVAALGGHFGVGVFDLLALVPLGSGVLLTPPLVYLLVDLQPPEQHSLGHSQDIAVVQVVFRHQWSCLLVVGDALETADTDAVEVEDLEYLVDQSEPVVVGEVGERLLIDEVVLGVVQVHLLVGVVVLVGEQVAGPDGVQQRVLLLQVQNQCLVLVQQQLDLLPLLDVVVYFGLVGEVVLASQERDQFEYLCP